MKEIYEFRIPEEDAQKVLAKSEGVSIDDFVRIVVVEPNDDLFEKIICARHKAWRQRGTLFASWSLRRHYSPEEIKEAKWFRMLLPSLTETAGEEVDPGLYDYSSACSVCGDNRQQVKPLAFDSSLLKLPKGKDITFTLGKEIVVRDQFAEACLKRKITGMRFDPVLKASRNPLAPLEDMPWKQLLCNFPPVEAVAPTKFGTGPTTKGQKGELDEAKCRFGHVAGLNILSEIYFSRPHKDADFMMTKQKIGSRRGFIYPEPLLIVSKRLRDFMVEDGVKKVSFEIAHCIG